MTPAKQKKSAVGKKCWYPWYPGDIKRDAAVQACPFFARSVWREMLDLMHDGEPYGHLTAGGRAILPEELARMIGGVTKKHVENALAELESRKVFSRNPDGIIYSRRMVRDEALRKARGDHGAESLDNPNVPRPRDENKDTSKDTLPREARIPEPNNGVPSLAEAEAEAEAKAEEKTVADAPLAKPKSPIPGLMKVYQDGFVGRFGVKPKIDGGKDGKLLKDLIQSHGRETVVACMEQLFRSDDSFICKSGYTIGVFSSVFNTLLIEIRGRPASANQARSSPRTSGNLAALDRFVSRGEQGVIDGCFSAKRLRAANDDPGGNAS